MQRVVLSATRSVINKSATVVSCSKCNYSTAFTQSILPNQAQGSSLSALSTSVSKTVTINRVILLVNNIHQL